MNEDTNASSVEQKPVFSEELFPMPSPTYLLGMERAGYRVSSGKDEDPYGLSEEEFEDEFPVPSATRREQASKGWIECLATADELPMPIEHVGEALDLTVDFIWYHRCYLQIKDEQHSPEQRQKIEESARRVEKRLGKTNIEPLTEEQYHFMHGRLSALRDALGWIGDGILDT